MNDVTDYTPLRFCSDVQVPAAVCSGSQLLSNFSYSYFVMQIIQR